MQNSFNSHIRLIILCPILCRRHEIRGPLPYRTRYYADVLITLHCSVTAQNRWRILLNFNSRLIKQLITQSHVTRGTFSTNPSSLSSRNSLRDDTTHSLIRSDKETENVNIVRQSWKFRTLFLLSTKLEILLTHCSIFSLFKNISQLFRMSLWKIILFKEHRECFSKIFLHLYSLY